MKNNHDTTVYNASTAAMLRSARVLMLNHSAEKHNDCGDLPDMITFVLDTVMDEALEAQSRSKPGQQKRRLAGHPSAEEVLLSAVSRMHNLIAVYRTAGSREEQENTGIALWNSFELVMATYSALLPGDGVRTRREARELYEFSGS